MADNDMRIDIYIHLDCLLGVTEKALSKIIQNGCDYESVAQ